MNTKHSRPDPGASSDSPVTDRVTQEAHQAVDSAGERAAHLERTVRHRASDAQERLSEEREAAALRMEDSLASVEDFIRRKPLAAAGIAFAAGILASKILSK